MSCRSPVLFQRRRSVELATEYSSVDRRGAIGVSRKSSAIRRVEIAAEPGKNVFTIKYIDEHLVAFPLPADGRVNLWVASVGSGSQRRPAKLWRCVNCVHPEGYELCQVLFSRRRFARTFSRCSRLLICSRPRRIALPPARRSTRPSITPPTSSPLSRSIRAPVTSTISSTVSATACRCCRPPTPASPRCRSWSTPQSRWPTRPCRAPSATPPSRTCPPPSPARQRTTCATPRATPARPRPPTCCSPARPAASPQRSEPPRSAAPPPRWLAQRLPTVRAQQPPLP